MAREPRECSIPEPTLQGHGVSRARPIQPIPLHEVGVVRDQRREQRRQIVGRHLTIRGHDGDQIYVGLLRALATGGDGCTHAEVFRVLDERDAPTRLFRSRRGLVPAPVIDHDDVVYVARDAFERALDERRLVVGRHHHGDRSSVEHGLSYRFDVRRSRPCTASASSVPRTAMAEVLFVSKPVAPPWNDSSKNLARDVAGHLERNVPVFVAAQRRSAAFSPGLIDNLSVLKELLWGANADLWHFFFAPNPKSSAAARFAASVRRIPTVHTVCSMPPEGTALKRLVFADATVVLSRFAQQRFLSAGVEASSLHLVPPSVPALEAPTAAERTALRRTHGFPEEAWLWIYPGDLEHGGGAEVSIDGFAAWQEPSKLLVMACREKTREAEHARARLIDRARQHGIDGKVRWVGETPHMHELLALSDVVVLPNLSPYAKMDYPLVALEAMCLGRPVIVGAGTPAAELAEDGGALAVEPEADALATAVDGLRSDEAARAALGRCARELALERFSPARVAAAYEEIYEGLLV